LGNPREALAELQGVQAEAQHHPDVLNLRWVIAAELADWAAALHTARSLAEAAPERASTWLHLAYALRRVPEGGVTAARDILRPAFTRFPQEPIIPYNLACYACVAGDLAEARRWLDQAFRRGDPARLKEMALADADLQPLWAELHPR
jgi:Flp pilus assembly protein TadD